MDTHSSQNAKDALRRAVEIAGGQAALAKSIGGKVRQAHVWKWLNTTKDGAPAEHCLAIEKLTGVSRYLLRPDVYGPPPHQKAA